MIEVNPYDDHKEFSGRLWYARSIVTLPERMNRKVTCHCGMSHYDAFRTVGASEIVRLRAIIDGLQERLEQYETQGSASAA